MNRHAPKSAFDQAVKAGPYDFGAERAIIVGCLADPARLADVAARIVPADFEGAFHRRVLEVLIGLHNEGRKPSLEALVAVLGDDEIAPNLTVRGYLKAIVADGLSTLFLPIEDAIETVLDAARRRAITETCAEISLAATLGHRSVAELAEDGVARFDAVLSSLRSNKRRTYSAGAAGTKALAALDGIGRSSPTTGLADLDRVIGGYPRGQLTIIAGRTGMGKSAVTTSSALKAATAGKSVCLFSLEMVDEQLGARMLTDLAYTHDGPIHYERILKREAVDATTRRRLEAAQKQLEALPIHIDEQRGLTVAEIAARARKWAATTEREGRTPEIIFVDHIGLVRPSGRYGDNRVRELAEITDGLASLAKELDAAVVGLCQLNRAVEGRENKRPVMTDLRESGAIEEDASVIIFLYRPAYYLERERFDDDEKEAVRRDRLRVAENKIELAVAKSRNGRVGIVDAFIDVGSNAVRNASFVR